MNTMLVVGASGLIGEAALAHFAGSTNWAVVGLSRRVPESAPLERFRHVAADLTDSQSCRVACQFMTEVSHVIYTAVSESPGLVSGWRSQSQMNTNAAMMRNIIEPLLENAPALEQVTVLQGAKAYGAHAGHQPRLPCREFEPRVPHDNFYWLQEDYIRDVAQRRGLNWTIFRPQVLIGAAWGAAMNPLIPVAVYAAIRREEGLSFSYPGGEHQVAELVDAALLAEAFEWAATAPAARNETFNITNGDVFSWRDAWPMLAAEFGVPTGQDEPMRLAGYLLDRGDVWQHVVERNGLRDVPLAALLGESHHYADMLLHAEATTIAHPTLLSTVKLRQAGFDSCRDSAHTLRYWVDVLRGRRLIPER